MEFTLIDGQDPRRRRDPREAGFTVLELAIAAAASAVLVLAAATVALALLREVGVVSTSSVAWAQSQTGVNRLVEEIRGADPGDNDASAGFLVSSTTIRFRLVGGMDATGARIRGHTVTYAITGPVAGEGGASTWQLVRWQRDSANVALVGKTVVLSDLTSPTDAASPSRFSYGVVDGASFITIKLVERRRAGRQSAASSVTVTAGVQERVRLRY